MYLWYCFFVGNTMKGSNIWGFIFSVFYYMMVVIDCIVIKVGKRNGDRRMKKKLMTVVLLGILFFAACGSSKPKEELDKFADEIVIGPDGDIWNPTTEPTATAAPVESGTSTDDTEKEENSAEESTDVTEEKYFVTFEANTVDGAVWNSEKFANSKLTMINVWATYCNPCLAEMPDLGELATEYDAADFQLIGIVSDVMAEDGADAVDYAKELIAETKANYPHLLLNESLYTSFVGAVSAVPTTFFVRQDGSLVGYLTGAMAKENWKALIDDLLEDEQ